MWLSSVLIVVSLAAPPEFAWMNLKVPGDLLTRLESAVPIGMALTADGTRLIVVTEHGATLFAGEPLARTWLRRFGMASVHHVAFLDTERVVATTGEELVQICLNDGRIVKRVACSGLEKFVVLPTGQLAGPSNGEGPCPFRNTVVSVDDGAYVAEYTVSVNDRMTGLDRVGGMHILKYGAITIETFSNEVAYGDFILSDQRGTRFAGGGGACNLWVADACLQHTRVLTRPWTRDYSFRAACFDPTGRYLLAGLNDRDRPRILVLDLLRPGQYSLYSVLGIPEASPCVNEFETNDENSAQAAIDGIGFLGKSYLWYAAGDILALCRWPDIEVEATVQVPRARVARCVCWKSTLDGKVLVRLDRAGNLQICRPSTSTQSDPEQP